MQGTHRWIIPDWSKIEQKQLYSEKFIVGGFAWQILVYPLGHADPHEHVSVFLDAAESDIFPDGWEQTVSLRFTVHGAAKSDDESEATINARSIQTSHQKMTFKVSDKGSAWGNPNLVSVAAIKDPAKGLVSRDDTVVISAEVTILRSNIAATCTKAAADGNLPALKWLRGLGNGVGRKDVRRGGSWWVPPSAEVFAYERLPVERIDVLRGGGGRTPFTAAMGALKRLSLERKRVHGGGEGQAFRNPQVLRRGI
jgi:hypothetical protein